MKFYLLTLQFSFFSFFLFGQPTFSIKPVTRQLFARDLSTNLAAVHFQGNVAIDGSNAYLIKRFKYVNGTDLAGEGTLDIELSLPSSGAFNFDDFIPVGLVNYRYRVYQVISPDNHIPFGADIAREVLAGDAYIVYGQSNAEAGGFTEDPNPLYQSNFIRAVGTRRADPPYDFSTWAIAEGTQYSDKTEPGSIGVWPLYVGRQIVDNFQVPVVIFSYPKSGAQIDELLRNDVNPINRNTPYGRLLRKVNASGLKNKIRGIFYFQGEGDASADASTVYYKTKFMELYNDFKLDFNGFTKILNFQIRPGVVSQDQALQIQEAQKELADELDDVVLISTNHIDHFTDNVHYGFEGYIECGKRAFNLVKKFFYNVALNPDEVSPVIFRAGKGTSNTVHAMLSPENATYTVDTDFRDLVRLEGAGTYNVTDVVMKDAILEIKYTRTGNDPSRLTILGKEGPASPSLYNSNGIGVVSMQGLNIDAALPLFFNYFKLEVFSDKMELKWEISENDIFESFAVLQSKDGRAWEPLLVQPAKSGQVEKYTCNIAGKEADTRYFRIHASKKNGNVVYSNILLINTLSKSKNWIVYPNPIDINSVISYWSEINTQISWKLYSLEGKNLSTGSFHISRGLNTVPLKLPAGLSKGLYLIRLETSQGVSYRRVIY